MQIRRPKSEGRKRAEIRSPKFRAAARSPSGAAATVHAKDLAQETLTPFAFLCALCVFAVNTGLPISAFGLLPS
jgi:hypothetical protein